MRYVSIADMGVSIADMAISIADTVVSIADMGVAGRPGNKRKQFSSFHYVCKNKITF